jgi:hypothetical protein
MLTLFAALAKLPENELTKAQPSVFGSILPRGNPRS